MKAVTRHFRQKSPHKKSNSCSSSISSSSSSSSSSSEDKRQQWSNISSGTAAAGQRYAMVMSAAGEVEFDLIHEVAIEALGLAA
eukprot:8906-Heterococcus_DN1.PRE.7